ncbi:uncharacterized protein KY384_001451 [Bacidia gigantensis]|uniref:uncharacterized protein n=1 Tax=Bacidia gigantensis TaxID=2732470 RepID=UPI001D03F7AC|nr:uncharacterized protein KY384_001451 [Bacidia gigantensis]KAG8533710.1 hypothetical protein KY384_001451 [Bacidia gigantensis]
MLPQRLITRRPLIRTLRSPARLPVACRSQRRWLSQEDVDDPGMNGGYQNPPPIIRQHRDPYADWWDKQERRNFGEPVHEDNDILGMFSPEDYNFYTAPQTFGLLGCFVATFVGACMVVKRFYPDKVAVDRGYEGGLDRELGGPGAVWARTEDGVDET